MKIFFTLLLFSLSAIMQAQPAIDWQHTFGGTEDDISPVIINAPDGGFLIAGSVQSSDYDITSNHGYYDIWVIKVDANGDEVWQRTYGGTQGDFVSAALFCSDGNYILAGSSQSSDGDLTVNKGSADVWILKINSTGDIIWQKTYGGSDIDEGTGLCETADGHLWVTGNTASSDGDVTTPKGGTDIWLLNLNEDGTLNWQKSFGGSLDDYGTAVAETDSSQFILAAYSYSNDGDITGHYESTEKCDYVAFKISDSGNIVWNKNYGGNENDHLTGMYHSYDGFLLYGNSDSDNGNITESHGLFDGWIIKINSNGGVLWQKSVGGTGNDYLSEIVQNTDSYLYVSGTTYSVDGDITENKGEADCWLLKLDPNGPLQWSLTFGGAMTEIANSLTLSGDEKIILGASTYSSDGDITDNIGLYDYWILQTGSIAAIHEESFSGNNYIVGPNPSDDYLTLTPVQNMGPADINICDVNGKCVLKNTLNGNKSETLDITSLPAGIYILNIRGNLQNTFQKIIIY